VSVAAGPSARFQRVIPSAASVTLADGSSEHPAANGEDPASHEPRWRSPGVPRCPCGRSRMDAGLWSAALSAIPMSFLFFTEPRPKAVMLSLHPTQTHLFYPTVLTPRSPGVLSAKPGCPCSPALDHGANGNRKKADGHASWGAPCRLARTSRQGSPKTRGRTANHRGEGSCRACRWPCAAPAAGKDSPAAVVDKAEHRANSLACWPPHWHCRPTHGEHGQEQSGDDRGSHGAHELLHRPPRFGRGRLGPPQIP
jgi:hypothetical protein